MIVVSEEERPASRGSLKSTGSGKGEVDQTGEGAKPEATEASTDKADDKKQGSHHSSRHSSRGEIFVLQYFLHYRLFS